MIPKIIHYCWFGRNPLPKSAIKCINSWRKFFPDYEIKEWNEDNFDINIIPYTAKAYNVRKYAFVSDYARFWILYKYGGLYFDTDVEVIKPMDDIIERGPFMGIETCIKDISIAPGLGLAFEAGNNICKEILDLYINDYDRISQFEKGNVVLFATRVLKDYGLKNSNTIQKIDTVTIYPIDYFNPYDYVKDRLLITNNTRCIHWFDGSWMSFWKKLRFKIGQNVRRFIYTSNPNTIK